MSGELISFALMVFGIVLTAVAAFVSSFFLLKLVIVPFIGIPASFVGLAIIVGMVITTGPIFWLYSVLGLALLALVGGLCN